MNRTDILTTAGDLINGQRARDYGDAAENFQRIADLWAPILGIDVAASDVALCLLQLKVARLVTSPAHADSWVDAAGYVALGGEIAAREVADAEPSVCGNTCFGWRCNRNAGHDGLHGYAGCYWGDATALAATTEEERAS